MSNKLIVYFALSPHIYAAQFNSSIIILDSRNDDYLSLIDDSALYFKSIVNQPFAFCSDSKKYKSVSENSESHILNDWIEQYLELNFIREKNTPGRLIASDPQKFGGLSDYQWDTKPSWQPFQHSKKINVLKAFFQLARVHRSLKRYGIKGVLDAIENTPYENLIVPSEQLIAKLADEIDAASMIYPKKTYCLAWAAAFVILARKNKWDCQLHIGVQAHPFYAHAWAEINGKVIHDDPQVAQVLSLILVSPEKK